MLKKALLCLTLGAVLVPLGVGCGGGDKAVYPSGTLPALKETKGEPVTPPPLPPAPK
jgi:hypothetical protein